MELDFWATTDVGRVRDHNEDNFLVDKRMQLFVVADGMGGHAAGEVASAMSVKVVRDVIANSREVFERLDEDPENLENRRNVLAVLESAISQACQSVWSTAREDASKQGMGTTTSLLLLTEGRGFIGHVGDSRVYLLRQGQAHQLTEDHSLVNEMLRLGKIQPGEEHKIPHKNAVTRAVGVNEFVEVDTFEFDVFSGDEFLLCSDGLCGYFDDDGPGEEITDLLGVDDVREATERCIRFANESGGKDNITSIVVRVSGQVNGRKREIQAVMEALRSTPYFQYLSYKEMVQIVNMTERIEHSAGEEICSETTNSDALFLIVDGEVRLERAGEVLGVFHTAEHFGETSIIDEHAKPFSATAVTDARLLAIRRERFMELLRQDSDLAVKLLWNFLQTFTIRLREFGQTVAEGGSEGMPEVTPSRNLVHEPDLRAMVDSDKTVERVIVDEDSEPTRVDSEPELQAASEPSLEVDSEPKDAPSVQISAGLQSEERDEDLYALEETIDMEAFDRSELAAAAAEQSSYADFEPEEDLRATVQMDQAEKETRTMPTLQAQIEAADQKPEAFGQEIEGDETMPPPGLRDQSSKAVSGESSTAGSSPAPKAQVLRRTKLGVDKGDDSTEDMTEAANTARKAPAQESSEEML